MERKEGRKNKEKLDERERERERERMKQDEGEKEGTIGGRRERNRTAKEEMGRLTKAMNNYLFVVHYFCV